MSKFLIIAIRYDERTKSFYNFFFHPYISCTLFLTLVFRPFLALVFCSFLTSSSLAGRGTCLSASDPDAFHGALLLSRSKGDTVPVSLSASLASLSAEPASLFPGPLPLPAGWGLFPCPAAGPLKPYQLAHGCKHLPPGYAFPGHKTSIVIKLHDFVFNKNHYSLVVFIANIFFVSYKEIACRL